MLAQAPGRPGRWLLQMGMVAVAGLCCAAVALLVPAEHTETRLLVAGSAGFGGAIAVCAALDRRGHTVRMGVRPP